MKIDGPWAQGAGERFHCIIEPVRIRPLPARGQNGVFRGIVTEDIKERVGHVGLEAKSGGTIHALKDIEHLLPTVHAAPADLSFSSQPLAHAFSDIASLIECLDDFSLV